MTEEKKQYTLEEAKEEFKKRHPYVQDYSREKVRNSFFAIVKQIEQCMRCENSYTEDTSKRTTDPVYFRPAVGNMYCLSYESFSATAKEEEDLKVQTGEREFTVFCKPFIFPCTEALELNDAGDCEMFEPIHEEEDSESFYFKRALKEQED